MPSNTTRKPLFNPDILKALDHHKVQYEIVNKPDGTSELRFEVKDKQQHRMLEQATGSRIRLHDPKNLKEQDKLMAKAVGWKEEEPEAKKQGDGDEEFSETTGVISTQQEMDPVWTEAETRKMLVFHKTQFAKALYGSNENPGLAVEFMNESVTDADNTQNHYSERTLGVPALHEKQRRARCGSRHIREEIPGAEQMGSRANRDRAGRRSGAGRR